MHRFFLSVLLTSLAVLLLASGSAAARPGQLVFVEAPTQLRDAKLRDDAITRILDLGATAVRIPLTWRNVAPQSDSRNRPDIDLSDPSSYNWDEYEAQLVALYDAGIKVLVTITGPAPRWATEGARDNITNPRASDFENFTTAVARQFGSRAAYYSIWNEPNFPSWLSPQFDSKGRATAPRMYRSLYQAALRGLARGGQAKAKVLLGELAPRSNKGGVAPLAFLRGVFCLSNSYKRDKNCGKLKMAGVALHPYTAKSGPFFVPSTKDDVTIGALSRLSKMLDRAGKTGAIAKKMPIFLTEFGVQSFPDKVSGVSLNTQSDFRSISEQIAWNNKRVYSFSQYLMRDDAPLGAFQTGLQFADGRAKPSYSGFRLPLVVRAQSSKKVSIWGLVRPSDGASSVTLQRAAKGSSSFKTIATKRTRSDGSFTLSSANGKGWRWRMQWRSKSGKRFTGTPTLAYKR
jgi:hypothetical protein